MKMTKISAVAFTATPANPEAGATFVMKTAGEVEVSTERVEKGMMVSVFTGIEGGHQHGVEITFYDGKPHMWVQSAKGPDEEGHGHDHSITISSDGQFVLSTNAGHSHELDTVAVANAMAAAVTKAQEAGITVEGAETFIKAAEAAKPPKESVMTEEEKARLAKAEAIATMNDAQKAHHAGLDDEAAAKFRDMSADDRDAVVEKAAKAAKSDDPVVYKSATSGAEFRKSDDPRLVDMAKREDEREAELLKARELAEETAHKSFAGEVLKNFSGEDKARFALAKAVSGIDDAETRDAVKSALKGANEALGMVSKNKGFTAGGDGQGDPVGGAEGGDMSKKEAETRLDDMAKARASKEGEDYLTAYDVVKRANPDLYNVAVRGK